MDIIKINEKNTLYEFVCDYENTRNGFAHKCTLFIDGRERAASRVHYINRTWECWTYQTACLNTLYSVINDYVAREKTAFKALYGYKAMTKKRLEEFNAALLEHENYQNMIACANNLRDKLH